MIPEVLSTSLAQRAVEFCEKKVSSVVFYLSLNRSISRFLEGKE